MKRWKLISLLFIALIIVGGGQVQAASPIVKFTTAATATYRANSSEAQDVQQWLARNAKFVNGSMLGDLDKIGDIEIVYARAGTSASPTAGPGGPGGGPPVPLPATGNPGDQISITSSSGGWTQTWSYTWTSSSGGGFWQLVEYHYFKNNPR
jgi:hypothetical protein